MEYLDLFAKFKTGFSRESQSNYEQWKETNFDEWRKTKSVKNEKPYQGLALLDVSTIILKGTDQKFLEEHTDYYHLNAILRRLNEENIAVAGIMDINLNNKALGDLKEFVKMIRHLFFLSSFLPRVYVTVDRNIYFLFQNKFNFINKVLPVINNNQIKLAAPNFYPIIVTPDRKKYVGNLIMTKWCGLAYTAIADWCKSHPFAMSFDPERGRRVGEMNQDLKDYLILNAIAAYDLKTKFKETNNDRTQ